MAQNTTNRASASDGRTTRHPGYAVSQIIRKRIEESFAWTKTIAGLHKTKHRGVGRVAFQFVFAMAAYKSIAGDRKRALKRTVPLNEEREVGDEGIEARGIQAKLDLKRIMTHFDDDPIAQKMLMGMADGIIGEDLRQAISLSPTEYESKRKKIRRRIEKLKT